MLFWLRERKYLPSFPTPAVTPPTCSSLTGSVVSLLRVTIINPLQHLTLDRAAEDQGYAISVVEQRKLRAHDDDCHRNGISFIPLAAESLGGWSDLAMDTIREIGKLQALRCNLPPSHSIHHLYQRLSITLWKGNANSWASRMPILSPLEDAWHVCIYICSAWVVIGAS